MPNTDNELIAKSKPVRGLAIFFLFGALFFGAICVLCLQNSIIDGYPQFLPFLFGGLLGTIAMFYIFGIYFWTGYFEVYLDRVVVFSPFRTKIKTLYIKDVIKTKEVFDANGRSLSIKLRTAKSRYTIARDDKEYDYDKIISVLHETESNIDKEVQNEEDQKQSQNKSAKKITLGVAIIGMMFYLLLIYSLLNSYIYPNAEINSLQFKTVIGRIDATPEIHERRGRRDHSYVRFELREYPKLLFEMQNSGYHATYLGELYKINPGDTVFLKIDAEDYHKKISLEKELDLADKINASDVILVYEFWDKQFKYLSLKDYKTANVSDGTIGLYLSFVFIGLYVWTGVKAIKIYREIR